MTTANGEDRPDVFAARVGLGLRELDGLEQPPDVSAVVARRLAEPAATPRHTGARLFAAAIALVAALVTVILFAWPHLGRGGADASVTAQEPATPAGPWRLVYELPADELQRQVREQRFASLWQALAQCVSNLAARLDDAAHGQGKHITVTPGGDLTVTIDLADASPELVARVRAGVETAGQLELRMLADADYRAPGVEPFDLPAEQAKLQAWLDAGGRARLQEAAAALADFHPLHPHLRWHVHRITPDPGHPGHWGVRYADLPVGAVAAHPSGQWNGGTIPAELRARPAAEQFLLELVPVNLHERHFTQAGLDPAAITKIGDRQDGLGPDVECALSAGRAAEFADFSEKHIGGFCALIWNGQMLSAPRFESRIPGRVRIGPCTSDQAEPIATALRSPLPVTPRLLRWEPRTAK